MNEKFIRLQSWVDKDHKDFIRKLGRILTKKESEVMRIIIAFEKKQFEKDRKKYVKKYSGKHIR